MDDSRYSLHKLPILNFDSSSYKYYSVSENLDRKLVQEFNYTDKDMEVLKEKRNKRSTAVNKKLIAQNQEHGLRRKSSSFKNIQKKLSVCTKFVSQAFQPATPPETTRKYKPKKSNRQRTFSNRNNDIRVLYTLTSKTRKLNDRRRKPNQRLIDSIYYTDQSCCYKKPNKKKLETCDAPKKQNNKNFSSKNVLSIGPHQYPSNCGMQCTVIDFPDYDKTDTEVEAINMIREDRQCQTEDTKRKDKQVAVTMARKSVTQRGGGDSVDVNNDPQKGGCYCIDPQKVRKTRTQNAKKSLSKIDCGQDIQDVPNKIYEKAFYLAKESLKYVIFALALLAWLPCILIVFSCWLLNYLLRPRYTCRNPKYRRKSPIKIHVHSNKHTADNASQTCENNSKWVHAVRGVNCTINSIATSFNAFKSLLHSSKIDSKDQHNIHHPSQKLFRNRSVNDRGIMTSESKKKCRINYSRNKRRVKKSGQLLPKRSNENQYKKNNIRKSRAECHCRRLHNGIGATVPSQKHYPHVQHYREPYSKPVVQIIRPHDKLGTCLPAHCCARHRYVCQNTSGLPVYVKLNPVLGRCKSIIPICQQPLRTQVCICKSPSAPTIRNKPTFKSKLYHYCKKTIFNLKKIIDNVETEIWKRDVRCDEIYIQTLRRKPLFFLYKMCPSFYPFCITTYKFYESVCHFLLLVISGCIWCPLFAFCYIYYAFFCNCLLR